MARRPGPLVRGVPAGEVGGRPVFLAPLRLEAAAIRRGAPGSTIERIGMGPGRASAARARLDRVLAAERPAFLLGIGGGLTGSLVPGDLVVASELAPIDHGEGCGLPLAAEIAALLESALARHPRRASGTGARGRRAPSVHLGPVVCSPRVLHGRRARDEAGSRGALAVDMESLWCAPLGRRHPFAVVRAVLDVPGSDLVSWRTPGAAAAAFRALALAARALADWAPGNIDPRIPLEV